MNGIFKRELVDQSGRPVPVTSFTRFGFARNGSKTGFVVLRTLSLVGIVVSLAFDWQVVDWYARAERKPNDGDHTYFWIRPQNLINLFVFVYLVAALYAASLKRKESDTMTDRPRVYLFLWNALPIMLAHTATSFEFYYNELRWNASKDLAFEFTGGFCFFACCLELLLGGWPASPIDVAAPMIVGVGFLVYVGLFAQIGLNFYAELDWNGNPNKAAGNAAIYLAVVLSNAVVITAVAMLRNKFNKRNDYQPILVA